MKFGPVPVREAKGAVLAHSVALPGGSIRKGVVLKAPDIDLLEVAGVAEVIVARLDPEDVPEDAAALRIGEVLAGEAVRLGVAATGRVNLIAERAGLIRVNAPAVAAMNAVDEGVTLACLQDLRRVGED